MKYTYKREIFLVDSTYKARVILAGVWIVIAVAAALFGLFSGELSFTLCAFIFGIPMLFLMRKSFKQAKERYEFWQEDRNKFLKNGYKMVGKIIGAGGHKYWKSNYAPEFKDDTGNNFYSTRESDWYIEVEYYDTLSSSVKRFIAKDMNADGKKLIGRAVDVYFYKEHIYIDIPKS